MTWRLVAALGALAVLLPARARAGEWQAGVGYEYLRDQNSVDGGPAVVSPTQGLDLDLGGSGSIVQRGLVDWFADVGYRWYDWKTDGATTAYGRGLRYALALDVFRNPRSPVWVTGSGSRSNLDFSAADAPGQLGNREITAYRAGLAVRAAARPNLDLSYTYTDINELNPVAPDMRLKTQNLVAITRHTTSSYSVSAQYEGGKSEGTIASDNHEDHNARAEMQYILADDAAFSVTDYYYRRVPTSTVDDVFNWAFESNTFNSSLRLGRSPEMTHEFSFVSSAASVRPVGGTLTARSRHSLRYLNDAPLAPEWRLRSNADVSYGQDRFDDTLLTATGESVGSQVWWRRFDGARLTEVLVGPSIGLLQDPVGEDAVAYGANATGRITRPVSVYALGAEYVLAYASNLFATRGWTLSQSLQGNATRPLGLGTLTGSLTLFGFRGSAPGIGDTASRNVAAVATYTLRRLTLQAQAGLNEGVASPTSIASDGLFVPVDYDARGYDVGGYATVGLLRALSLGLRGRYASLSAPDRPAQTTSELWANLTWAYGPWYVTVEDKIRKNTFATTTSVSSNTFMVRFSRRFAGRF